MGAPDTVTKDFTRDPARFADIFDQHIYHGRQVIKPEELTELDTTEIVMPYGEGAASPLQKYRDVLKNLTIKTDNKAIYCLLGLENQQLIHYAAPVKVALYDLMNLTGQVAEAARAHREAKDKASQAEFLSGFYKGDKLIPVVTLVFYWGSQPWDGPLSLRDMYENPGDELLRYAIDYHLNLIAPSSLSDEDIDLFKTDVREASLFVKYCRDKEKLRKLVNSDEKFKSVSRQTVDLINTVTGSSLKYQAGKETIDMCKALEDIREEGRHEGRHEGWSAGLSEGFAGALAVMAKLREGLTPEAISSQNNLPLSKVNEIARMMSL